MSRKNIEASREARLWLGLILTVGTALIASPYVVEGVKVVYDKAKDTIKKEKEKKEQRKWKKEHPDIEVVGSETIKQEL